MLGTGCFNMEEKRILAANARIEKAAVELKSTPSNEAAWKELQQAAHDRSRFVRGQLALSLGELADLPDGPMKDDVIRQIIALLNDSKYGVIKMAVRALAKFGESASPALPKLEEIIKTNISDDVSWYAIETLGAMRHKAEPAVPTLIWVLQHEGNNGQFKYEARRAAASALAQIGANAKDALPLLHRLVSSSDPRTNDVMKQSIEIITAEQKDDPTGSGR